MDSFAATLAAPGSDLTLAAASLVILAFGGGLVAVLARRRKATPKHADVTDSACCCRRGRPCRPALIVDAPADAAAASPLDLLTDK